VTCPETRSPGGLDGGRRADVHRKRKLVDPASREDGSPSSGETTPDLQRRRVGVPRRRCSSAGSQPANGAIAGQRGTKRLSNVWDWELHQAGRVTVWISCQLIGRASVAASPESVCSPGAMNATARARNRLSSGKATSKKFRGPSSKVSITAGDCRSRVPARKSTSSAAASVRYPLRARNSRSASSSCASTTWYEKTGTPPQSSRGRRAVMNSGREPSTTANLGNVLAPRGSECGCKRHVA